MLRLAPVKKLRDLVLVYGLRQICRAVEMCDWQCDIIIDFARKDAALLQIAPIAQCSFRKRNIVSGGVPGPRGGWFRYQILRVGQSVLMCCVENRSERCRVFFA